jgi:hypothetical protein
MCTAASNYPVTSQTLKPIRWFVHKIVTVDSPLVCGWWRLRVTLWGVTASRGLGRCWRKGTSYICCWNCNGNRVFLLVRQNTAYRKGPCLQCNDRLLLIHEIGHKIRWVSDYVSDWLANQNPIQLSSRFCVCWTVQQIYFFRTQNRSDNLNVLPFTSKSDTKSDTTLKARVDGH